MTANLITAEDILSLTGPLSRDGRNYQCGCLECYSFANANQGTGMKFRNGDRGAGVIIKNFTCSKGHTGESVLAHLRKVLKKGATGQVSAKPKTNNATKSATNNNGKENKPVFTETARWIYKHADGTPDIRIIRLDAPGCKKKFSQAHKNGVWINKKKPGLQPLYRWDLIHNSTREMIIVEGEKAADAAAALFTDYDVTTWPGGTSTVLEADWERITGRTVILWPDNDADDKGLFAMRKLALRLLELNCAVRVVDTSCLPDTGDLADPEPPGISYAAMLEAAKPYTEQELADMAANEPPSDVAPDKEQAPELLDIIATTTICQTDYPERRWIVRDILGEGLAMLAAAPKVGKTLFVTQLAVCVATGRDFLGYKTTRGSVLYIDGEADERGMKYRLRAQGWPDGADGFYTVHPRPGWQLTPENIKALERTIIEKLPNLQLIIVDTLERLIPHPEKTYGKNAYETGVARLAYLQAWVQEKQISVLLIHHTKKGAASGEAYDAASGSRGITGTVETPMTLSREDGNRFILNVVTRYAPSVELLLERQGVLWTLLGDPALAGLTDDQQAIYDYVKKNGNVSPKETAKETKIKNDTVTKLMKRMATKKGLLRRTSYGRYEINPEISAGESLRTSVLTVPLSVNHNANKGQKDKKDRGTANARARENPISPAPDADLCCTVCGSPDVTIGAPGGPFCSERCEQSATERTPATAEVAR